MEVFDDVRLVALDVPNNIAMTCPAFSASAVNLSSNAVTCGIHCCKAGANIDPSALDNIFV